MSVLSFGLELVDIVNPALLNRKEIKIIAVVISLVCRAEEFTVTELNAGLTISLKKKKN